MKITMTDKDLGRITFDPHQIHNIQFGIPDRLGVGVMTEGIKGHEGGLYIVPTDPQDVSVMFMALAERFKI